MTDIIVFIHSWLRWIIVILGVLLIIKGFIGMSNGKPFTKATNTQSAMFTGFFHLQALLGLIMYFFFSNITKTAMENFGTAMKNAELRFWAVEHGLIMLIAVVLVQIGRKRILKNHDDRKKHKAMAIFFLIAMILVASRIPWDEADRLLRGF